MACDPPPGPPTAFQDALAAPTGDALLPSILAQTPRGAAWRTDEMADGHHESTQHRFWRAVAEPVADLYVKAWKLALASTAATLSGPEDATNDALRDWEMDFGLPEPCMTAAPLDVAERKLVLRAKVAARGGQSIAYFECLAQTFGYRVEIAEYRPLRCGEGRCGETQIGAPFNEVFWRVSVNTSTVRYFRAGQGRCGVDPLGAFAKRQDLECLLNKWKPAHTQIRFRYLYVGGLDFARPENSARIALLMG